MDDKRHGFYGWEGIGMIDVNIGIDDWAKVELFRWQYGELPTSGDHRKLDISVGLENIAKAIEKGYQSGNACVMPSPFNVVEVLLFCARKLK
jgi:hypothetical protein